MEAVAMLLSRRSAPFPVAVVNYIERRVGDVPLGVDQDRTFQNVLAPENQEINKQHTLKGFPSQGIY